MNVKVGTATTVQAVSEQCIGLRAVIDQYSYTEGDWLPTAVGAKMLVQQLQSPCDQNGTKWSLTGRKVVVKWSPNS